MKMTVEAEYQDRTVGGLSGLTTLLYSLFWSL